VAHLSPPAIVNCSPTSDDDGSPVHYLTARMLDDQPPALRWLLPRLRVPRELHPALVNRLAGPNGQRLLAALTRGNNVVERALGAPGERACTA